MCHLRSSKWRKQFVSSTIDCHLFSKPGPCPFGYSHRTEHEPVTQESHSQELSQATDQTEQNRKEVSEKLQTINAMEILLDHSVKYARSKKCCSTCARPLNPSEMQSFMHKLVSILLS